MTNSPAGYSAYAASTGQPLASGEWLDVHFDAWQVEYERALDLVGVQSGWRVLDAGCGGGSFLPSIARRVGASGHVTGLDLAADNVRHARARLDATPAPCPVQVEQGSLLALPFPDAAFDAVWIANVLMYMTDEGWGRALAECRRVVRPGGLVAAKEADGRLWNFWPIPDAFLSPIKGDAAPADFAGLLQTRLLPFAFARAGLTVVHRETIVIERWAPLPAADRLFLGRFLAARAEVANAARDRLPEEVWAFWQAQANPESPDALINDPAFACVGGHLVVVGRAPG